MLHRIKVSLKLAYWSFKNPTVLNVAMFKMLSDILALILKVATENKHMVSHIAFVELKTDNPTPMVSIWAGAGEGASPIRRIEELIVENTELRRRLGKTPQDSL
jgi:hypothetical protein